MKEKKITKQQCKGKHERPQPSQNVLQEVAARV